MVDKKSGALIAGEKAIKTIKLLNDPDVLNSLMNLKLGDVQTKLLSKFKKIRKEAKGGMINKYAKGGEVKGYMGGGSVRKNKNKMLTTKGWGASRKT